MVGILISFWDGNFSGAKMLVSGNVPIMIRDPRLTSVKNSVPNKHQATQSASALKAAACASLNDTGIASDFNECQKTHGAYDFLFWAT